MICHVTMPGRLNWKMWQTDFFFFLPAGIPFIYSGSGSKSNAGGQAVKKGYIFSIFAKYPPPGSKSSCNVLPDLIFRLLMTIFL